MPNTATHIAAAIAQTNATLTDSGEYRYHDEGTQSDWLVSAADLALLTSEYDGDYSLWCADTDATEVQAD
jgi:hypothetical protein